MLVQYIFYMALQMAIDRADQIDRGMCFGWISMIDGCVLGGSG